MDSGKNLHVSIYIVIYEFILGLLELILGMGMLLFEKQAYSLYLRLLTKELIEDPNDLLARIFQKIVPVLSENRGYFILGLLIFGLVKIIGAFGLTYHKRWGLDLLIGAIMLLLPFEITTLFSHFSVLKLAFFMINILIALYLVNFQPQSYFKNLHHRIKNK